MKNLLLFCFLAISYLAQGQTYSWTVVNTGPGNVFSSDVTTDANGNVYTIGFFSGQVDFNPSPGVLNLSSAGDNDIFIQKLDSAGAFIWARRIGGTLSDVASTLYVDANNNVHLVGSFQNTVDFDPGAGTYNLTANGGRDAFVMKLDANGNFLWAHPFGGSLDDIATGVISDGSGAVYACGSFYNTVDFDPNPNATANLTSAGSRDVFVLKLTSQGAYSWAFNQGSSSLDFSGRVHLDDQEDLYVTGSFTGTVDMDPAASVFNLSSNGGRDIFVQKLSTSPLSLQWAKGFGTTSSEPYHDSYLTANGTCHVTGSFQGTVDFDPGPGIATRSSNGSNDVFINVLDKNGNHKWASSFGAGIEDEGYGISVDALGNVYTTGYFAQNCDFDPGPGVVNLNGGTIGDAFVHKLDSSGNFVWAYKIGNTLFDIGEGLEIDPFGNILIVGYFRGTVDFNPSPAVDNRTSAGNYAGFTTRLLTDFTCAPSSSILNPVTCGDYLSPAGNTYSQSGTYSDTLVNLCGSDSIVTINLTVNQPSNFSDTVAACGSFQWQGQTLTSSGTYRDTLVNATNCDSILTLNLTINSSSSFSETVAACGSYQWRGQTLTSSGTYTDTLVNALNCDSILTLSLTLTNIDTTLTLAGDSLTANQAGASYQWIDCDSGMPIQGATSQSYLPAVSGSYAVVITSGVCSDTSACEAVVVLGNPDSQLLSMELFPNPSQGEFTLRVHGLISPAVITVYDLHGKLVAKQSITTGSQKMNLSHLGHGVFLLHIRSGDRYGTRRIKVD